MSFIKSAMIGAGLALVLTILGLIPFINFCICFVNPLIMVLAGYVLCQFTNIKAGDYGALGINLLIYSIAGAAVSALIGFVLQMLGLGLGAVGGADITQLGMTAAGGIIGIAFSFILQMIAMFVLGVIGGLIYLFTKK